MAAGEEVDEVAGGPSGMGVDRIGEVGYRAREGQAAGVYGAGFTMLSSRINGHRSSSNSPDDLPLPVAIHTRSHHLPFNSCWNVRVLHHLTPNTDQITCRHLELAYQFVLSSRLSPGINLR